MDTKTFSIGLLSLTALILFVANMLVSSNAEANTVIKDRDYQMITARVTSGGEALYIVDNRSGQMGVFTYDNRTHSVVPRNVRPVADAFLVRP